ncbi:MAG: hypothetical protein H0T89_28955 [Deltaproteobacteria bacterium]|nr:hypothetical protein [Deltaproteobacteria bacterium]MDQ3300933.1 hypothetical protein [Myxococcota bacterium]
MSVKRVALGPVAMLAMLGACEGRKPEPSGIGRWRFTKSVKADAKEGVCQPTELTDGRKATWCFALPPYKVANRTADVDLYFNGTADDSPLIEIQLKIRGCVEDDLDRWMRSVFGPPIETKPTRGYWKNSFLWAAAMMPSEPGRCLVHVLPLSEAAEIARIKER